MRQPRRANSRFSVHAHARRCALAAAALWSCAALPVDYRVIAEQNLFDPQRKPWSEPDVAAAATRLGPEDVRVEGVVVIGGVKRAVVRLGGRLKPPGNAAGRPTLILGEGQTVGGYMLESVQAQQLVFVSGGERFTVPFTRSTHRETASAPPTPLPVIQSATLPVAETAPGAHPAPVAAVSPQTPPPAVPMQVQQPAPQTAARPAQAPPMFPGSQPAGAATPSAPATGMTLLQAIQAAEAARRAGQIPSAPPVNPFQPRPQP